MGFRFSRVVTLGAVMALLAGSVQATAQAAPVAESAQVSTGVHTPMGDTKAAKNWSLQLRTAQGKKLSPVRMKNGGKSPKLVVGKRYKVTGKVPAPVRSRMRGQAVRLQSRPVTGGTWTNVKRVDLAKSGRFNETFTVGRKLLHKRDYRVTATIKPKARSLAATSTTSSATTTATAVVQFDIVLNNDSGDNLVVTAPTAQTSAGNYTPSSFNLDNNQSVTLVYTNPPPGNAIVWSVQKQNCFGPNCTTYRTSWTYTPTRDSVPCSSAGPQITSGSSYTVWMKPQFGSGYDGYFAGPLAGAGAATTTCTFQLVEEIDNWIENNPAKAFAAIVVAVVIVALIVGATVATGGADIVAADATLDVIALDEGWDDPEEVFNLIDPNYIPQ